MTTIQDIERMQQSAVDSYRQKIDYSSPAFYLALAAVVFVGMYIFSKKRKK